MVLAVLVDRALPGVIVRAARLLVFVLAVEDDFVEEILVVTVEGVLPGIIVREARLLLLLLPTVEYLRVWIEEEGVCVLLEATSTVRFTG